MNAIYYSKQDIKNLIPLYNTQGENCEGNYGKVYKIPFENKAVKLFGCPKANHKQIKQALELRDNAILEKYNAIVPKEEVFVDQVLEGYTMRLIRGYTVSELYEAKYIPEISFAKMKSAYFQASKELKKIEKAKIKMEDMYPRNIMYDLDHDCFCFIDIDLWHKDKDIPSLTKRFNEVIDLNELKKKMDNDNAHFLYMNRVYYNAEEISKLLDEEITFPERFIKNNLIINVCKGPKESYFIDQIEAKNEKNYLLIKTIDETRDIEEKVKNIDAEEGKEKQFKLQKMNKALKVASSFAIQFEDASVEETFLWNAEHHCFIYLGSIRKIKQPFLRKMKKQIKKVLAKKRFDSKENKGIICRM